MSQNFNQPPLDNAPIPLFLEDPVPKKKTYEIDELINFLAETKQVCDDMAALGFKHKEYFEAAKVQREYADKYQAVIDALKA
ncbi:MAG: hypothetical protein SVT56_13210, partial [Chloroflexota bacterium]|nr:hypothetical protein [Chloroflexota bacterium]